MEQQIISNDIDALCAAISDLTGIILFDGFLGTGKTYQANLVAVKLGVPHLDLDIYFLGGDPNRLFVEVLTDRANDIRDDIRRNKRGHKLILISTICAREIVRALKLRDVHYVYVEIFRRSSLRHEVLQYHTNNNPRKKSGIIYQRQDQIEEDQVTAILECM